MDGGGGGREGGREGGRGRVGREVEEGSPEKKRLFVCECVPKRKTINSTRKREAKGK